MDKQEAQSKAIHAKVRKSPNQDYRGRVERFRAAGGDEKYVNVKKKALARRDEVSVTQGNKRITGSAAPKVADNYPL
jgi:hypothetical protein